MFWTRSDYFRALIDDHFHEGSWDERASRATIPINHVAPDIFAIVVSHVYSNKQQVYFNESICGIFTKLFQWECPLF